MQSTFRIPNDIAIRFKSAAKTRGMTLNAWLIQAGLAYAKNNENFNRRQGIRERWASGWAKDRKCLACEKFHDPLVAHPEVFPSGQFDEYEKAMGDV